MLRVTFSWPHNPSYPTVQWTIWDWLHQVPGLHCSGVANRIIRELSVFGRMFGCSPPAVTEQIFTDSSLHNCAYTTPTIIYWVNLSKRGGMVGVFQGLVGLVHGIFQGQSQREILRSSRASPRKTLSIPPLCLRFTFYLKYVLKLFLCSLSINKMSQ